MYVKVQTHSRPQSSILLVAIAAVSLPLLPLLSGTVLSPSLDISLDNVTALRRDFGNLPLSFEPNVGQTDPSVRFLTHASDGTLYFTPGEVVLSLPPGTKSKGEGAQSSAAGKLTPNTQYASQASQSTVVRMQFVDSNTSATIQTGDLLPGKVNYLIGNDPTKWQADLPTYGNITYRGLYSGIDLAYSGPGGQLKGTYTVAAGSDPSLIQWRYSGAQSVSVDETGNLQITVATLAASDTSSDTQPVTVTEQAPVAWQEIAGTRIPVSARYLIGPDQSIGFDLGNYDRSHPLIIDPTLTYSTYLGGSGYDRGEAIALDASGNAYVTGYTYSTNFPMQNPFQPIYFGDVDAFVTKFSATGSTLLYSTYLGGSADEYGRGITVDASGNAYVTGFTYSTNFPRQNPYQSTLGGDSDAFVTKLSATGSILLYSTYLGRSGTEVGSGIVVDTFGNAYVTGYTNSANFPLQNPFQPTFGGGSDVFVTKFSATGSTLLYSTYLGGNSTDVSWGITVDASGNAYVTGYTYSTNFPRQNPFQPTFGGDVDAFATKFSATGSTLLYSTYLGGSGDEYGSGIAVDTFGNAYVTGYTASTNFPMQTLHNPFQGTHGGGGHDVFVTKFSATGSTLLYSTYLGGNSTDVGEGISVDASGNAYIAGYTTSTNFPLQNPFQPTRGGGCDVFVAKISDQCAPAVNGHLTYQGMPQPNAGNVQPITLKLQPTGGGPLSTYNANADQNGNFTINLGSLPAGAYNWWLKSPRYLASTGSLTLTGACTTTYDFGTQRAGDVDNTNLVDITDFSLLRASFGKACGDVGYNPNAEYTGDCLVDISDFSLLRGNFGQAGPPQPTGPAGTNTGVRAGNNR